MDTQDLAIIIPSLTAVLVLAGNLWYQRWLTDRTLTQQADVTQKTLDHERGIARDERVQERISSTYVEMLEMLDWIMEIVNATQPMLEPGPESRRLRRVAPQGGSRPEAPIRWCRRQRRSTRRRVHANGYGSSSSSSADTSSSTIILSVSESPGAHVA